MTNYSIRNRAHVVNNKISRWPQDEIDILDGNCSFNIKVSNNHINKYLLLIR